MSPDVMRLIDREELAQMRADLRLLGRTVDAMLGRMRGTAIRTWPALRHVIAVFDQRFPEGTRHGDLWADRNQPVAPVESTEHVLAEEGREWAGGEIASISWQPTLAPAAAAAVEKWRALPALDREWAFGELTGAAPGEQAALAVLRALCEG